MFDFTKITNLTKRGSSMMKNYHISKAFWEEIKRKSGDRAYEIPISDDTSVFEQLKYILEAHNCEIKPVKH